MPLIKAVGTMSLITSFTSGQYSTGNFAIFPGEDYGSTVQMDPGVSYNLLLRNKNSFTQTSFGSVGITLDTVSIDSQTVEELNIFVISSTESRWYRLTNANVTYEQPSTGTSYINHAYAHVYGDSLYVALHMKQVTSSGNRFSIVAMKYNLTDTSITQVWGQNIYVGEGSNATGTVPSVSNYDYVNNQYMVSFPACASLNGSTIGLPVQVRLDGTYGTIVGTSGLSVSLYYPEWATMVNSSVGYNLNPDRRTTGSATIKYSWVVSYASTYAFTPSNDGNIYYVYSDGLRKYNPFTNAYTITTVTFGSIYSTTKSLWRIAVDDTYIYLLVPSLSSVLNSPCGIFKFNKSNFSFVKSMRIETNHALSLDLTPKYNISVVGDKLYVSGTNVIMSFNKDLNIVPPGQFMVTTPAYGDIYYTLTSTITPTVTPSSSTLTTTANALPSGSSASSHDTNPTLSLTQLTTTTKAT